MDPLHLDRALSSGDAWNTPWKITNALLRYALVPSARIRFALAGVGWGEGWKIFGLPVIQRHRQSTITIGARLTLRSWTRSNPLSPNHAVVLSSYRRGARLAIGDDFGMSGGSIVSEASITIGDRVLVGANVVITDTDFHPLDPVRRHQQRPGRAAPIVIEDDVFIGMQAIVMKGVTIGTGTVIGAGSVVTSDIPAGVVAAGNPARVLKKLSNAR